MPAKNDEEIATIIEKIIMGEIKLYSPLKNAPADDNLKKQRNTFGLPCLKCLNEEGSYSTENPSIVISYENNGRTITFYLHERCLRESLSK